VADAGDELCVRIALNGKHAAFAEGGHGFCAVEAKAPEIAEGAHVLAVDAGIQRLCAVFHHSDAVFFRSSMMAACRSASSRWTQTMALVFS
jgi:hypothetical protein